MWILPKQLHTSAYVPDTAVLISDLAEQSQICELSLLARSKPSLARTWSQKWKRDSWTQHLSGRILKPSHGQTFVTAWTSSLEVIPASHSQQPGSDSDETTLDTSGLGSQMELELCDLGSASLRTSKDTSASDSERSSANWKALVTLRRGEYSQRVKSALLTNASGCLSWPSPIASEVRQGFQDRSRGMKGSQESLTTVVVKDATNWPTPATRDHHSQGSNHNQAAQSSSLATVLEKHGLPAPVNPSTNGSRQELWLTPRANEPDSDLNFAARNADRGAHCHGTLSSQAKDQSWATPNTMDYMEPRPVEAMKRMLDHGQRKNRKWSSNVREQVVWDQNYAPAWPTICAGDYRTPPTNSGISGQTIMPSSEHALPKAAGGKLNPRWVETLMGLPIGWTMPSCITPLTIAPTNCDCLETESCQPPQPELF